MAIELPYPEDQHDARVMCGDPVACAYEWMSAYTKNLNEQISQSYDAEENGYNDSELTLEEIIETAMTHVEGESRWGGEYISKGGAFEGVSTDPTFWEKLAIFKEIDIPQDKRNNFFSCSC